MSLSWRERVVVALAPGAMQALRTRSGEKRSLAGDWHEGLPRLLEGWPRAAVSIVLSNRLVRYVVVPPSRDVHGEVEELALARHHFGKLHGERVREWHLCYSPATGLASAIDRSLLDGVKGVLARRLVSLQPYLSAAYNRLRSRIPAEGAWLLLPEAGATCVALFERGRWSGVSVSRAAPEEALARERLRMGGAKTPSTVIAPDKAQELVP